MTATAQNFLPQSSLDPLELAAAVVADGGYSSWNEALDDIHELIAAGWDASKHPRGKNGKFIKKGLLAPSVMKLLQGATVTRGDDGDFNDNEKQELASSIANMTPLQWNALTKDQKDSIQESADKLLNEDIPNSSMASLKLEDLTESEDDDFDTPDLFDPTTPLPAAPAGSFFDDEDVAPTHIPIDMSQFSPKDIVKLAKGIDKKTWNALHDSEKKGLLNGVDQAQYADYTNNENLFVDAQEAMEKISEVTGTQFYDLYNAYVTDPFNTSSSSAETSLNDVEVTTSAPVTPSKATINELFGDDEKDAFLKEIKEETAKIHESKVKESAAEKAMSQSLTSWKQMTEDEQQILVDKVAVEEAYGVKDANEAYTHLMWLDKNSPKAAPTKIDGKSLPSPAGSTAQKIKITHALIHAKHQAGDVIAMHSGVKVTWNGKSYDVISGSGKKVFKDVAKSKLYALLADKYPNKQWFAPGKQENEAINAPSMAATKPAAAPIPHPVNPTPVSSEPELSSIADINNAYFTGKITVGKYTELMAKYGHAEPEPSTPYLTSEELSKQLFKGLITKDEYDSLMTQFGHPADPLVAKYSNAKPVNDVIEDETAKSVAAMLSGDWDAAKKSIDNIKEAQSTIAPSIVPTTSGAIKDLTGWKKVGPKSGSNLGGMYAALNGEKYYVKKPKTDDHVQNEVLAASLYKAAGVDVPEVTKGTNSDLAPGLVVVSKIIEGKNASSKLSTPVFKAKAQQGFAVDAWLANWDTVGLAKDNIIDVDGKPVRIDAGGSLLYRAQGNKKPFPSNKVDELDTLRDPSKNAQAASVFGDMSFGQQRESAKMLLNVTDDKITQLIKDAGYTGNIAVAMFKTLRDRRKIILEKYDLLKNDKSGAKTGVTPTAVPIPKKTGLDLPWLDDEHNLTPYQQQNALNFVNSGTQDDWDKLSANQQLAITDIIDDAIEDEVYGAEDAHFKLLGFANVNPDDVVSTPNATPQTLIEAIDEAYKNALPGQLMGETKSPSGNKITVTKGFKHKAVIVTHFNENGAPGNAPTISINTLISAYGGEPWTPVGSSTPSTPAAPTITTGATTTLPSSPSIPTGLVGLSSFAKQNFYNTFKAEKVSPAWSGAKIYSSIQVAKQKNSGNPLIANLTDGEMLDLVDEQLKMQHPGKYSGSPYKDKVVEWLKTPNGKKAALKAKSATPHTAPIKSTTAPTPTPIATTTPTPTPSTAIKVVNPPNDSFIVTDYKGKQYDLFAVAQFMPDGVEVAEGDFDSEGVKKLVTGTLNGEKVIYIQEYDEKTDTYSNDHIVSSAWLKYSPGVTWDISNDTASVQKNINTGKFAFKTTTTTTSAPTPVVGKTPIPEAIAATQSLLNTPSGDMAVGLSSTQILSIWEDFKSKGASSYLSADPETLFTEAFETSKKFGVELGKVVKIIDAQKAQKLGVTNAFMYEKKIKDWLSDPTNLDSITHTFPFDADKMLQHNAPSVNTIIPLASQPSGLKAEILAKSSGDFKIISNSQAKSWAQSTTPLTAAQKTDLKYYTTNAGYSAMNNALRGKTKPSPALLKRIKNAQDGMRPLDQDVLLHRGTSFSQFGNAKNADDVKKLVGKTVQDKGFLSASVGGTAAFGGQVKMEIEVPKGTGAMFVDHFSAYKGENELLLSAGLRYRVISVTKSGYQTIVRVRVVPPPDGSV